MELEPQTTENEGGSQLLDLLLAKPGTAPGIPESTLVRVLNQFYAKTMQKCWDQLEPREILSLRGDAMKLKSRSGYRS
jgi:hypothetical protein